MNIKIYQIRNIRDCDYAFCDYDESKFNLNDYSCVFYAVFPETDEDNFTILDNLFCEFNDYKKMEEANYVGRSMSVSDVVDIDGNKYYCQAIGWKKI